MAELTRRYVVMTMAADMPFNANDPDEVFVLKPWKDPAALRALLAYRDNCYPELARDLDAWIRAIQEGPAVRGDVGRRNEPFVKVVVDAAARNGDARPARRRRRVRAKTSKRTKSGARTAKRKKPRR